MKDKLGIKVCCNNCENALDSCYGDKEEVCQSQDYCFFIATTEALEKRIKELQEQQFAKKEAEKIERFLIHGYQMMINENKKIFSKLEKMKGEQ